jgi:hypothetical protein
MPSDQPPPENPGEKKVTAQDEERRGGEEKLSRPAIDLAALIDAINTEGSANRRENRREDGAKRFREWITIVLLGITATAVFWQVHEMIKVYGPVKDQADAAIRQSENAERALIAANRPWVTADISVNGPIVYNVNGVNFTLNFRLKNIGHSPALNVWAEPKVIAPAPGIYQTFDPRAELQKVIATLKARPPIPNPLGFAIFPGDVIDQPITVSINPDELKQITQKVDFIMPTIIGAIDYRHGFDTKAHETGFIIDIRRADSPRPISTTKNRSPAAIFPDEGDIPAADVRLYRSFIDGGFAD